MTPAERAAEALSRHAPELSGGVLRTLGHGLDNAAFATGDLVVRAGTSGSDVSREARLLEAVGSQVSLPVPEPVFVDGDLGVLAYRHLPGRSLLGRAAPRGSATTLGAFLGELHAIDPASLVDVAAVENDPAVYVADLSGPEDLVVVTRASIPPPAERLVLAHADLGAEHLLETAGSLTGVLDWTDAAVTDPAADFGRLYRDFGPDFLAEALDAYGGLPGAMPRIEFYARCAALEDLAYGVETGRDAYRRTAERALARLFPDY